MQSSIAKGPEQAKKPALPEPRDKYRTRPILSLQNLDPKIWTVPPMLTPLQGVKTPPKSHVYTEMAEIKEHGGVEVSHTQLTICRTVLKYNVNVR